MKIRNGFVSNSSSTSFCLYGACIENIEGRLVKLGLATKSEIKNDVYDVVDKLLRGTGLEFVNDSESYVAYIGRSYSTIGDDETGKQFKNSVEETLKKLKIEEKPDLYEGEIFN